MSYRSSFEEIERSGSQALHRLCSGGQPLEQVLDILRVLIRSKLGTARDAVSKIDLDSAAIRFRELFPDNTDIKASVLNEIADQVAAVASEFSGEVQDDVDFYYMYIGRDGLSLPALLIAATEALHEDACASIRKYWLEEIQFARNRRINKLLKFSCAIGYMLLAYAFVIFSMGESKDYLLAVFGMIPIVGQIAAIVGYFFTQGVLAGFASMGMAILTLLPFGFIDDIDKKFPCDRKSST